VVRADQVLDLQHLLRERRVCLDEHLQGQGHTGQGRGQQCLNC
jgi:hypothetical protein